VRLPPEERLWLRVEKGASCWLWSGKVDRSGYGSLWVRGGKVQAHRFSWFLAKGPVPSGLCVLHSCDFPACVNPAHLFLGTRGDNNRDRARKGRSAKGDKHYSRREPHRLARGDQNGSRTRPESLERGSGRYCAKMTEDSVQEVRERYARGEGSLKKLSEEYGVNQTTLHRALMGKTWAHVGGPLHVPRKRAMRSER